MAQIANPFRDQAIETYKLAIDKGKELQAYSPAMREAVAAEAKLRGEKQPAAEAMLLCVQVGELADVVGDHAAECQCEICI